MNAKLQSRAVSLSATFLILVIIGYNIWSYCDGRCTVETLLTFSFPAELLLAGIFIAATFLYRYKNRNRHSLQQSFCRCGGKLRATWKYCPACGTPRKS